MDDARWIRGVRWFDFRCFLFVFMMENFKTAFIFPGQGSQKVGMGREMTEQLAGADAVWSQASAILGFDLQSICFDGPEEALKNTLYAQPALLVVGYLHFLRAREANRDFAMVAGHSLGEYTALVAAGALPFEAALQLVKRRAELMSQAPAGAMAALIGLPDEKLDPVLAAASQSGIVVAANFNSPGQIVVSGAPDAVAAAMKIAKESGAKLAVSLPVSGAFHSPLMADAGREMADLIDAAPFGTARVPVYPNTSARATTDAKELQNALKPQMTGAVMWSQSVTQMISDGATNFVELGPGNVLTGLVKRIDKSVSLENL